jgi:hypothetical protein
VSVSGFARICMDEDGNEKRVSPFPLTWKERSEMYVHFPYFDLSPVLCLLLSHFGNPAVNFAFYFLSHVQPLCL